MTGGHSNVQGVSTKRPRSLNTDSSRLVAGVVRWRLSKFAGARDVTAANVEPVTGEVPPRDVVRHGLLHAPAKPLAQRAVTVALLGYVRFSSSGLSRAALSTRSELVYAISGFLACCRQFQELVFVRVVFRACCEQSKIVRLVAIIICIVHARPAVAVQNKRTPASSQLGQNF